MPQPVKLSDPLVESARRAAADAHRSLAAQVEHWASLGRAVDGALTSQQSASLKATASRTPVSELPPELAKALTLATSPGFPSVVKAAWSPAPGALYGTHPAFPGYLIRREPDGRLIPGRMVDREFVPAGDAGDTSGAY